MCVRRRALLVVLLSVLVVVFANGASANLHHAPTVFHSLSLFADEPSGCGGG